MSDDNTNDTFTEEMLKKFGELKGMLTEKALYDIEQVATKHHPLVALEALTTLTALALSHLDLPLKYAVEQIEDRLTLVNGFHSTEDKIAFIDSLIDGREGVNVEKLKELKGLLLEEEEGSIASVHKLRVVPDSDEDAPLSPLDLDDIEC